MKVRAVCVHSLRSFTTEFASQTRSRLLRTSLSAHPPRCRRYRAVPCGGLLRRCSIAYRRTIFRNRVIASEARQSTYMLQYSHEKWSPHNQIPPKLHRKQPIYAYFYVIFKDFPSFKIKIHSKSLPKAPFCILKSIFLVLFLKIYIEICTFH